MEKIITSCIICQEEINRSIKHSLYKERRSKNAVTCSKQCARIYTRVRTYIWNRMKKKVEGGIKNEI